MGTDWRPHLSFVAAARGGLFDRLLKYCETGMPADRAPVEHLAVGRRHSAEFDFRDGDTSHGPAFIAQLLR